MEDKYYPTPEWFSELRNKIMQYREAKHARDYARSDRLRSELMDAGVVDLDRAPAWHPVAESVESRQRRLAHL